MPIASRIGSRPPQPWIGEGVTGMDGWKPEGSIRGHPRGRTFLWPEISMDVQKQWSHEVHSSRATFSMWLWWLKWTVYVINIYGQICIHGVMVVKMNGLIVFGKNTNRNFPEREQSSLMLSGIVRSLVLKCFMEWCRLMGVRNFGHWQVYLSGCIMAVNTNRCIFYAS